MIFLIVLAKAKARNHLVKLYSQLPLNMHHKLLKH